MLMSIDRDILEEIMSNWEKKKLINPDVSIIDRYDKYMDDLERANELNFL